MKKLPNEELTDDSGRAHLELEKKLGISHNPENQVSGGPIEGLKEGWAKMGFCGNKVHYFKDSTPPDLPYIFKGERIAIYESLCGMEIPTSTKASMLFHPGT